MVKYLRECWRLPGARLVAGGLLLGSGLGAAPAQAAPAPLPRILKLYDTADPRQDSVFALDGYLTLEVSGLARYMREEEARLLQRQLAPDKAHAQAQRLVLYINDAPLIGMLPESVHTVPLAAVPAIPADSTGSSRLAPPDTLTKVIFHLTRRQNTYPYWNVVYSSPWEFAHPGKIGLGYDDRVITNMYPQAGSSIRLKLVRPVALVVALLAVALLAVAIVLLGRRSWLLRNAVPNWAAPNGRQPMFSLAKSQLAWWTFLVLGAYLLIYCVTGEMTNISTTTLQLLGISAGTAGVGSLIGRPASDAVVPPVSRGWWLDMLSDEQGVSIHRLQQVGFTLLLGYLFIRTVYKTVALPEWNENEILLLGISSATYLGLKSQENKSANSLSPNSPVGPVFAALTAQAAGAEIVPPVVVMTVNAAPPEDPTAAVAVGPPAVTGSAESSADPVTGAVQYRVEDDMGPNSSADSPAGALILSAPIENPNLVPG